MRTVTVGGKERPFRFSFRAISKYCNKSKIQGIGSFMRHVEDIPIQNFPDLFFYGFEDGAKKEGQEVDFKAADVADWLDEDMTLLQRCSEALGAELSGNMGAGEKEAEEGEKN